MGFVDNHKYIENGQPYRLSRKSAQVVLWGTEEFQEKRLDGKQKKKENDTFPEGGSADSAGKNPKHLSPGMQWT